MKLKKIYTLFLPLAFSLLVAPQATHAQELPVFSQKLTDGFLYNPSLAGLDYGMVNYTFQRQHVALDRAFENHFFSGQMPLMDGSIGAGLTVFNEKANFLRSIHVAGSFAYHLVLGTSSSLSFGVSAEYSDINLDMNAIRVESDDPFSDPLLANFPGATQFDFTFGTTLKVNGLTIGGSANRLSNFLGLGPEDDISPLYFPHFFTGFAAYQLPLMDGRDFLEPRLHFRHVSGFDINLLDAGLYYHFNELLIVGGSYRSNSTFNVSVGVSWERFTLAYSRQSFANQYAGDFGGSDEITLLFTFSENMKFSNLGLGGLGRKKDGKVQTDGKKLYNRPARRQNRNKPQR